MKIVDIKCSTIRLPFRFSFGHSLASRNNSSNIIVKVVLKSDSGSLVTGYGESVPRDYVTGETVEGAIRMISEEFAPRLEQMHFSTAFDAITELKRIFFELNLDKRSLGASWCAVELAVLDAVSRAQDLSVAGLLAAYNVVRDPVGANRRTGSVVSASIASSVVYGAVVPFGGLAAFSALLFFFKSYGFKTVKMKVGRDWKADLNRLKLARLIMGDETVLRIDANCAWTVDETLYFAEKMRPFNVTSIEQPLDPEDLAGMQRLTRELPETVVADESLCTLMHAQQLIDLKACDAFNIRLSKVGGPLIASDIVDLARRSNISCFLGAQVGESAILSAAGRAWASVAGPFENAEGSFNRFLLSQDLAREDLTFGYGGVGKVLEGPGFGITVNEKKIRSLTISDNSRSIAPIGVAGA
ncbi:MAG: hypothetical protein K2Z81_23290 [Cyanobacteria bacterium]|nr:hypothetical protein [Cyanobacteriota bacterium]